jgi:hypothetical protein
MEIILKKRAKYKISCVDLNDKTNNNIKDHYPVSPDIKK